jgi:hypothetical protein
VLHNSIRAGDTAHVWRTKYRDYESGIVAIGRVEELPRLLSTSTRGLFALPQRLAAAGWDETKAPSSWKTGIRVMQTFWNSPLQPGIRPYQGTVRRLNDLEVSAIEAEINARSR